ncbi:hypothetical protein BU16DRAFT_80083 [Lophium mytilinum]|uniref:Uncharacterized protein n=1 Tax=Lophium mytilinum TaxID=390894 RepID=A0A6A6QMY0_9PEZI|nr:hypothetical protein BU16DRAFT_80083 [Lophium mytilinum]
MSRKRIEVAWTVVSQHRLLKRSRIVRVGLNTERTNHTHGRCSSQEGLDWLNDSQVRVLWKEPWQGRHEERPVQARSTEIARPVTATRLQSVCSAALRHRDGVHALPLGGLGIRLWDSPGRVPACVSQRKVSIQTAFAPPVPLSSGHTRYSARECAEKSTLGRSGRWRNLGQPLHLGSDTHGIASVVKSQPWKHSSRQPSRPTDWLQRERVVEQVDTASGRRPGVSKSRSTAGAAVEGFRGVISRRGR